MLLGALAGCAVVFIRDTLGPQFGLRISSVQAEVRCKADFRGLLEMLGALPDIQELELHIAIDSPDSDEKIQALYQAWLQRCPVYLALTKPMSVKTVLGRSA
ncbi:MAG: OsmC family protein [Acidobacteria bacterium]|nr:OsmC family protein [Acidobacteriota bacterium]MCU0254902.1 OsmC family protein [Acidobacteriota bacterium]